MLETVFFFALITTAGNSFDFGRKGEGTLSCHIFRQNHKPLLISYLKTLSDFGVVGFISRAFGILCNSNVFKLIRKHCYENITLTLTLILTGLTGLPYSLGAQTAPRTASQHFVFQPLPYAYDALEPYIDAMTMEIHYSRHHRAYYNNFIKAVEGTEMTTMAIEDIFANISKYPAAVRNNGGGYYNHTLFWENMTPSGADKPSGKLAKAIDKTFGSLAEMKTAFAVAGATRFGSGWAWLSSDAGGNLFISSTPNQDTP